jgi:hypothetical protein
LFGPTSGAAHLEIRGEEISMTLDGHPVAKRIADYNSVTGLLSVIRRDLEACAEAAKKADQSGNTPIFSRGRFNPQYGYPTTYQRVTPNGTNAGWRVVRFVKK